jgi:Domain of unknown function (DUF4386)
MKRLDKPLPRPVRTRILGAVYFLFFATAIAGEVFNRRAGISAAQLAISGNMADTMLSHATSIRVGVALGLISIAFYIAVTVLLFGLFRPSSPSLALTAMCLSLMGLAVQTVGVLLQLAPFAVWSVNANVRGFDTRQAKTLAATFLQLKTEADQIGLVFDGLFLLLLGYLIIRSTFIPAIIGALIGVAALGWLSYLSPSLANHLQPYVQILGFIAEAVLMLWLLVVGPSAPTAPRSSVQASALFEATSLP